MKQYISTINKPIVLDKAVSMDGYDFLKECQVDDTIRDILLNNIDEVYFARSGDVCFYVLDGIPSFYR